MIDWRYRHGRANADNYCIELGLYKLGDTGQPRWIPTPLVAQFKSCLADPEASVGYLRSRVPEEEKLAFVAAGA
jgi:hypothetical protein